MLVKLYLSPRIGLKITKTTHKNRLETATTTVVFHHIQSSPIGSMYGVYIYIYTYIWLIFMVNVGKYTIHGSYGSVHTATPEMLGVGSPGILGSTTILHR